MLYFKNKVKVYGAVRPMFYIEEFEAQKPVEREKKLFVSDRILFVLTMIAITSSKSFCGILDIRNSYIVISRGNTYAIIYQFCIRE